MRSKLLRSGFIVVLLLSVLGVAIGLSLPSPIDGVAPLTRFITSVMPKLDFHLPTPTPHP